MNIVKFFLVKIVFIVIVLLVMAVLVSCESASFVVVEQEELPQRLTKIIAHRGFWNTEGSYENTLTSLEKAFSIGADGVEFDVWSTKDEILVVHHDPNHHGLKINETTYSKLSRYKMPNGEILPTLRDYLHKLKEFPNLVAFLEIEDMKAAELAPKIVEQEGIENEIFYISFMKYACNQMLSEDNSLHVELLFGNGHPYSTFQLLNEGFKGIDYSFDCFKSNPNIIKEAKKSGLTISTWTVNTVEGYEWASQEGIDFITTDRPDLFVEYSLSDGRYWKNNIRP